MNSEITARAAIKSQLDSLIVDKSGVTWDALSSDARDYSITGVDIFRGENILADIESEYIDNTVKIYIEWGDYTKDYYAMSPQYPIDTDVEFTLVLATSNTDDPQGNLLRAQQVIFDKLKTYNNLRGPLPVAGRFTYFADKSITLLQMRYQLTKVST